MLIKGRTIYFKELLTGLFCGTIKKVRTSFHHYTHYGRVLFKISLSYWSISHQLSIGRKKNLRRAKIAVYMRYTTRYRLTVNKPINTWLPGSCRWFAVHFRV